MKTKLIMVFYLFVGVAATGCATQEDMLYADLWSGSPDAYVTHSSEDVRDLGKTPRDKMLDQRTLDEQRKSQSIKDNLIGGIVGGVIDGMIKGTFEKVFGSD
ncbi:hypothetical protein PVT68_14785 [Microbulbifer bruguierae]|uniref:Lipoprotein n=1 Tax=Microbulbifer bruguierae TaxID=3029061 RepID=A0ABY8NC95_9GAMM|nr:hypothetical protein [Microbulbifer bruguierae]WGL16029.1 hypothetical protein PVT68_14785 [Microbulbifer bruguierae]